MISHPSDWWRQASDRPKLVLVLLWLITIVSGLGLRDPWPADEPRFALIAEEMVDGGEWLFPHRGGELYPDKPPLFMWTQAAFLKITGNLRLAFLLPSALSALAILLLVYDLGRRLWNEQTAFHAGIVLLTTFQFTLQGRTAQIDAMASLWITLGLYGLLRHLLQGPNWTLNYMGWASMGLGVITKGIGFLPLFLFIPLALDKLRNGETIRPRGKDMIRWLVSPMFLLAAIAIWLVPMLLAVQSRGTPELLAYRDNILFHQTGERYAQAWGHLRPFYYYFSNVIPFLWLPWSLTIPWLVPHWKRAIQARDRRITLLLGWLILMILFFSLSAGKRGVYLLPGVPALALLVAGFWNQLFKSVWIHRLFWILALVTSIALITAGFAVFLGMVTIESSSPISFGLLALVFLLGIVGLSGCWLFRIRTPALAMALFLGVFWPLYGFWAYPLLNDLRTPKRILDRVESRLLPEDELAILDWREQFLLFAERPIVHAKYHAPKDLQEETLVRWLQQRPHRWALIPTELDYVCFNVDRGESMGHAHGQTWILLGTDALEQGCLRTDSPSVKLRE